MYCVLYQFPVISFPALFYCFTFSLKYQLQYNIKKLCNFEGPLPPSFWNSDNVSFEFPELSREFCSWLAHVYDVATRKYTSSATPTKHLTASNCFIIEFYDIAILFNMILVYPCILVWN